MVVYDELRNMEEAINDSHNTEATEKNSPAERAIPQDKSYLETSTQEDRHNKDDMNQSCLYKPLSSPKLRQRKKNISMFEVQPSAALEITEVQQLCIETGMQQYVKENVTILPELTLNPELNTARSVTTTSEANVRQKTETPSVSRGTPDGSDQDLRKVVIGKDNEWMGLGSKLDTPRIPSRPATSPVSPNTRRRSVGVLMTPAWGLRTYRDLDKSENKSWTSPSSSPSFRRRSLVLPGRHVQATQSPSFLRKRPLVSPDVTELTPRNDCTNYNERSDSVQELREPEEEYLLKDQEQQSELGNDNKSEVQSQRNINSRVLKEETNCCLDDEFEDFRPRLRSRSLDEYRTEARKNVLQNRERRLHVHERDTRSPQCRRKSFETWLTEKEQETIKKLHFLTLEKQRSVEDEVKRKEQRKGKSYEEWLNEKNNMAPAREGFLASGKQGETTKLATQERQQVSQRRYDKWLMEKEAQALEKEREMLKQAKLKTIEMRKKHEEKKRNKLNFLTRALLS